MKRISQNLFIVWFSLVGNALAAGETPLSFTLDGTLYDSPAGTNTLADSAARVRVQILPPAGSCVLYDEEQTVNTVSSDGAFNIQVGTAVGSGRRVSGSDSGNAMTAVFQNNNSISGNAGGCTYSPVAGDVRRVRVIVTPTSGSPDTLTPDMVMSSVPSALVADTLQGVPRSGFLQLGAGSLSQSNVENVFSSSNYSTLTSLLAGTGASSSGGYAINAGTGGSGGIDFNVNGSTKAAIANNGNFSVDSGSFFVDAASNRVGIGTSTPGASLDLGAKTDAVILPNGTTAQRPSPASAGMIRFNASSGKLEFHNGTAWADLGSDISGIAAGGDLSGTYPNPGVAKIRGQAVSAVASLDGQVLRFNGTNYAPAFVAMADLRSRTTGAAALTSSCTPSQTLTWNSVTDTLSCTNITGLDGNVITAGTIDAARLPSSVKQWDAATGGINYAGGSVGVGTTAPSEKLHVAGNIFSSGDLIVGENKGMLFGPSGSARIIGSSFDNNIVLQTSGNLAAVVDGNGRVGIGTNNPNERLDVLAPSAGYIAGFSDGTQTLNFFTGSGYAAVGSKAGHLRLYSDDDADKSLDIDTNGNIGIGTSAPAGKLDVYQSANGAGLLALSTPGTGAAQQLGLNYLTKANGSALGAAGNKGWQVGARGDAWSNTSQRNDLFFSFWNGGSWNQSLTFDSVTGNIGVGLVAPAYPLDVNGTVNATAYYLNGSPFTPGSTASTVPATGGSASSATQSGTNAATGDRTALTLRNNGTGGAFEYNLIGQNAAGTATSSIKQDGSAYFGGNLNIGTTTGAAALNVGGQGELVRVGSTGDFDAYINFQNGRGYVGYDDSQNMVVQAGSSKGIKFGVNNNTWNSGTALTLSTTGTAALTPANTTDTSGLVNQLSVTSTLAPTAATSAAVNGISSQLTTSTTNNFTGGLVGVKSYVNHNAAGTVGDSYGVYSAVNQNHSSGTTSSMYGIYNDVTDTNGAVGSAYGTYNYVRNANAGTIGGMYGTYTWLRNVGAGSTSNAYGSYVTLQTNGTGVVTNGYGFYSANPSVATAGTLTNFYGLYIQNPTTATNNYSIYSAGGLNYFAGKVGIGSTAPANALDVTGTAMANTLLASNAGAGDAGLVRLVNTNSGGTSSLIFEGASNIVKSMLRSGFSSGSTDAYLSFSTRGSNTVGERMRIDSAGNVGIGSASPAYTLDVNGTVNATSYLLNGTTFAPGTTSSSVATTGGTVGANTQTATNAATADRTALTLRNNGTGGAFEYNLIGQNAAGTTTSSIKQDGTAYFGSNLSVGLTSTAYGTLSVGGSMGVAAFNTTPMMYLYRLGSAPTPNTQVGGISIRPSDGTAQVATAGIGAFVTAGATVATGSVPTDLTFSTGSTSAVERVRILSDGKVGIGTTNPTDQLHVYKDQASQTSVTVRNNDTGGGSGVSVKSDSVTTSLISYGSLAGNSGAVSSTGHLDLTSSGASTNLRFKTNSTQRMVIDSTGNVGIGSTTPTQPLDVNGNVKAGRVIANGTNNNAAIPHFSFNSDSDTGMYLIANDTIGFATAGQEKMRFANGSLGIGTTAPGSLLHIANATSATLKFDHIGDHQSDIFDDGDFHINSNSRKLWINDYNNGNVLINAGGGNVAIGTTNAPSYKLDVNGDLRITGTPYRDGGDIAWTVPSDARLKDVLGSYEHGLDDVAKLSTVRFRYKAGNAAGASTDKEYAGVLAQDVQKVIPEAVTVNEKNGFLNLNSSPIFWSVVNAVKELKQRSDRAFELLASNASSQKRELQSVMRENEAVKAENQAIKAYLCAKDPSAPFCRK